MFRFALILLVPWVLTGCSGGLWTKSWVYNNVMKKRCPHCQEEIHPAAKVCFHCGRSF